MYVCMYVCMYFCLSVCLSVWMVVCLSVCVFVCLSVCLPNQSLQWRHEMDKCSDAWYEDHGVAVGYVRCIIYVYSIILFLKHKYRFIYIRKTSYLPGFFKYRLYIKTHSLLMIQDQLNNVYHWTLDNHSYNEADIWRQIHLVNSLTSWIERSLDN